MTQVNFSVNEFIQDSDLSETNSYSTVVADLPDDATYNLIPENIEGYETTITNENDQYVITYTKKAEPKTQEFYPMNVSDMLLVSSPTDITVSWKDPEDTVVEGQTLVTWAGTKLVMKEGSSPASVDDGTLLVDNTVRNQYATEGFTTPNLTPGEEYCFKLFPYSNEGIYNTNDVNDIAGTVQSNRIMTAIIDQNNPDPATCVTYADDALNMDVGSDAWDDFFGIYPCTLKDGVEGKKINKNDFSLYEDGTPVATDGSEGDIVVKFPIHGISISTDENKKITVKMTNEIDNTDFTYIPFTKANIQKDSFYLGAYLTSSFNSSYWSVPNQRPYIGNVNQQASQVLTKGIGYSVMGFYQLLYLQIMFILKYKTLNINTDLGYGRIAVEGASAVLKTGGTELWGMDSQNVKITNPEYLVDKNHHMKLFGLEDLVGNALTMIDGFYSTTKNKVLYLLVTTDNDFENGTYTEIKYSKPPAGFMSEAFGDNVLGFVKKSTLSTATQTTYYCNWANIYSGGSEGSKYMGCLQPNITTDQSSIFYLNTSFSVTTSNRIMYL